MKRIYFLYAIILILVILVGMFILPRKGGSPEQISMMNISSPEFKNGEAIPSKFTCDGLNINPEFRISGVPAGAKSLALIMDDPDIPEAVKTRLGINVFDHWVAFNIPPAISAISEKTEPEGTSGANSSGKAGYTGPCPPDREHRYFIKLYALDTMLNLPAKSSRQDVEKAMYGHILEQTELIGTYKRK